MMFIWWLIKRAAKHWLEILFLCVILAPPCELALNLNMGHTEGDTLWFPISVTSWATMIVLVIVVIIYKIVEYITNLHTEYRAGQPEKPKPKNDDVIMATTEHYTSMMDNGFDIPPEPLTGSMADNRFAQEAHAIQLVAYAKAIGIRSERKEYFEDESGE